jgi:fucose 4-O-acetylase-like acetyltransferase
MVPADSNRGGKMGNGQIVKERIEWIDVAKGMAILMVTLLHANLVVSLSGIDTFFSADIHEFLEPVRMPLFFLVSGFFASSSIRSSWKSLWNRRIAQYIWLLVIWSTIMWLLSKVPAFEGDPAFPADFISFLKTIVRPFSFIWFLWCLPVYFISAKLIQRINRRFVLVALTAVSVLGFALSELRNQDGLIDFIVASKAYTGALKFFLFFWAATQYRNEILARVPKSVVYATVLAVAFATCVMILWYSDQAAVDAFVSVPAAAAGVLLLLALAKVTHRSLPWGAAKLRSMGARTVPLYVTQMPVLMLLVLPLKGVDSLTPPVASLVHLPLAWIAILSAALISRFADALNLSWLFTAPAWVKLRDARTNPAAT